MVRGRLLLVLELMLVKPLMIASLMIVVIDISCISRSPLVMLVLLPLKEVLLLPLDRGLPVLLLLLDLVPG